MKSFWSCGILSCGMKAQLKSKRKSETTKTVIIKQTQREDKNDENDFIDVDRFGRRRSTVIITVEYMDRSNILKREETVFYSCTDITLKD